MECQCEECTGPCQRRAGWFRPGEIEKSAELLGMSVQEFFDKYLWVDYWLMDGDIEQPLWVLTPGVKGSETGQEAPFSPIGECVFFKDGLCSIHDAKPDECAFFDHTKTDEECRVNRKEIVKEWGEQKDQIVNLLGREPALGEIDVNSVLGFIEDAAPPEFSKCFSELMRMVRDLSDEQRPSSSI